MKKWYRVTLDLAYEDDILRRATRAERATLEAKEILEHVVSLDIGDALRKTAAGPVDWTVVSAEPIP